MTSEQYLGEFEHLLLLAILRLGDEAYGVTIRQALIQRAERSASFGAVYSTLRRLERKGYVTSRLGEPEGTPGGRAKKFFQLTPDGLQALRGSQRRIAQMGAGLDELLESGEGEA